MKIKTKFKIAGAIISLSFLFASFASASRTFFEPAAPDLKVGEKFQTNLYIDMQGVSVNAIEGQIVFPADLLSLTQINDGNSIINFWIERPAYKNGVIPFSGIIPGGYSSSKGLLLSLVFQSKAMGSGQAEVQNMKILANDGQGTPLTATPKPAVFQVTENITAPAATSSPVIIPAATSNSPVITIPATATSADGQINPSGSVNYQGPSTIGVGDKEQILPEVFAPKVVSDSNMFNGNYFLVFATQDKGSGIDYYSIQEQKVWSLFNHRFVLADTGWNKTDSPSLLKDQGLHSFIYVKAVDRNGNERMAAVSPQNPLKWFDIWWIWVIIVWVLTILCFSAYFITIKTCPKKAQKE